MKYCIFGFYFACLCLVAEGRPWIALFGSVECEECAKVKNEWVQEFNAPDDPVMLFLPIEEGGNYRRLSQLEKALDIEDKRGVFPVFLIGNKMIYDIETFWELEDDFATLAAMAPEIPETAEMFEAASKADKPLVTVVVKTEKKNVSVQENDAYLAFFMQKSCAKCSRQHHELEALKAEYPKLDIAEFDVASVDGQVMLARFHARFKVEESSKNLAPMVCWSDGFITGRLAEAEELKAKLTASSDDCFWLPEITDEERGAARATGQKTLNSLLLTTVILGGLGDGINPCAFATSLFLISYLIMRRKKRFEIAVIGFSFCAGVFVAYFLFGMGMSFLIDFLGRNAWIKNTIYLVFAAISLILAIGHLRDALKYKKSGDTGDMDLGLSKEKHKQIHEQIRKLTSHGSWLLLPASILLGMIVSSMEFACTGQVYFPTIAAINSTGVTWQSLMLLVIYNICFILPLVVVTVLAIRGSGVAKVTEWAKNNVFATKISMSLVFLIITAVMVASVLIKFE